MIIIIGFKFNPPIIHNSDPHGTKCTAERYPLARFFQIEFSIIEGIYLAATQLVSEPQPPHFELMPVGKRTINFKVGLLKSMTVANKYLHRSGYQNNNFLNFRQSIAILLSVGRSQLALDYNIFVIGKILLYVILVYNIILLSNNTHYLKKSGKWVPLCCTLGAMWITIYCRRVKFESNDNYHCIRKTILNEDDLSAYDIIFSAKLMKNLSN
ncbi:Uncharacterized protein FWK35_00027089 [Aphis craccivora]|uniref:Uncharacterized protein n=1 Tax=Aphis craccivora TaxID=307492 RepID=A0A6G0WF48_APHCR|nr:Uncharacterized protein FWK35_00027089 [Aphis craccivora]